jgi:hypothetical protein
MRPVAQRKAPTTYSQIPCIFYKKSTCLEGDQCLYLHEGRPPFITQPIFPFNPSDPQYTQDEELYELDASDNLTLEELMAEDPEDDEEELMTFGDMTQSQTRALVQSMHGNTVIVNNPFLE